MSVLKNKRHESTYEYVYCAYQIEKECLSFLTRLSNRYQRLLANEIMRLSTLLVTSVVSANDAYPSDEIRKQMREKCLLEARAANSALDVQLSLCYNVMLSNPQGCFSNEKITANDAIQKLDNMASNIGTLIDKENALLTNMLKNNKIK